MFSHYLLVAGLSLPLCAGASAMQDSTPTSTGDGEQFLLGPAENHLLGLRTVWQTSVPLTTGATATAVFLPSGDSAFVADSHCHMSRIMVRTGTRMWTNACGRATDRVLDIDRAQYTQGSSAGERATRSGGAEVDDVLVTLDAAIATFDANTGHFSRGQKLEKVPTTRSVVFDKYLIFGARGGQLAWQQYRVGFLWKCNELGGTIKAMPIRVGDQIAAASSSGEVALVNPATTRQYWRRKLPGGIDGTLAHGADAVFAASDDQSVYAFEQSTGKTRWRYITETPLKCNLFSDGERVYGQLPGQGLVALNARTESMGTTEVAWKCSVQGDVLCRMGAMLLVWDIPSRTMTAVEASSGIIDHRVTIPRAIALEATSEIDPDIFIVSADGLLQRLEPAAAPAAVNTAAAASTGSQGAP